MRRRQALGRLDAEALPEHGRQRLDLHLAEPGQRRDPLPQIVRVGCLAPEPRGVGAVLVLDESSQLLHARRHRAGEAMHRRLLAEGGLDLGRVAVRDLQRSEPLLDLERPQERCRDGHLLVEREADQQGERIGGEELVRLVAVRVVEPIRCCHGHP